jgi:hypothetical protein
LLFDYPTIETLADFLSARVLGLAPTSQQPTEDKRTALIEQVAALSDEEAERLLLEELADDATRVGLGGAR